MSVSKIKNLILLILALAIIGLLPAVVPTQAARVGSEKKVHEKLEALYESYGLSLDASSLPASQTLYSIELENPDAKPAAQALLGGKAAEEEAPARMLAQYSAGSSTLQLSRSGQLEGRFTDASAAHDLTRATRRYLRSMDFDIAEIFEPVRLSAGVYSVTAVQSLCGVPVFESALTFTYRNSALSRVDGTYYPAGEIVRVSQRACISCADALVARLGRKRDCLVRAGLCPLRDRIERAALCAGLAD